MLDQRHADGESYEAIRAHGIEPTTELNELFARVAFTILVGNTDDHLRNHGFVHAGAGQWLLSPAFDINPSPERGRVLKTHISEASGDEASIEALLRNAALFGLKAKDADDIVARMSATNWQAVMKDAGMKPREIDAYRDAFDHKESATARTRGNTRIRQASPSGTPTGTSHGRE